ncbi:MAG: DinB family protein [Terriglobales bacterium]
MLSPPATLTANANTSLRPQPGESAPYYDRYISLVPGNDILGAFEDQRRQTILFLSGRTDADGDLRYAPDKWSLNEVLGHINDTERIMAYRALRISRGDVTPIEGYEQDDYVRNSPWTRRTLADLIEDYIAVRRATISLFRNLDDAAWSRRGTANKNEVSVRALAYIIAGHELHHRRMIEEKYLK